MHVRHSLSVFLLAFAAPALAQSGSVRDFRLPPDPEATPTPQVQGPVDPEAPIPTTPRVIPTDSPTPRATASPAPVPVPTQEAPQRVPPQAQPTARPTTAPTRGSAPSTPPPRPAPTTQAAGEEATSAAMDGEPTAESASSTPTAESTPPPPSQPEIAPAAPTSASEDGPGWALWLAALVAALAVAGGLFAFLRRRANAPAPAIERPLTRPVEPTPAPTPEAAPAPAPAPPLSLGETPISPAPISPARLSSPTPSPGAPLSLSAQPVRFSRTMMNATFACRIVLENRGGSAWEDIVVEADLVTAHGAVPIGDQLADPATPLASVHDVAALPAGESMELATDVRLPLQQVRPIRQGSAAVYVPLLRLRVVTPGMAPVAQTYLIGQLPDRPGGRLRPFRLDEIPQVYQAIGIRALGDQA